MLWAAAAVGVSHLVQSTRAGGEYGFGLALIILVTLVLKYPFFDYGPRYAAATGESLVEGYAKIGRWALWLYLLLTLATAMIVWSAILLFTAFLTNYTLGLGWPIPVTSTVLLIGCALLLKVGRFRALDRSVKAIMALLAISTLVAATAALPRADFSTVTLFPTAVDWSVARFGFLLALVGWMPSAIDVAVCSSLWTLAKDESSGERTSVDMARLDFGIGYWGSAVLAYGFLALGATVMYDSGTSFSPQGTAFSVQLIDLYAQTLGNWARPIVLVAVLTTMLSTTLTVVDGFPRAIERSAERLGPNRTSLLSSAGGGRLYWISYAALSLVTIIVLSRFIGSFTAMIDFATTLSFLTAPILGYLNLRAVTSPDVPPADRPSRAMLAISWLGVVVLGGTGIAYLIWRSF